METKNKKVVRKVGDTVYYMQYEGPRKGSIKGIASVVGHFETSGFTSKGTEETPNVSYCVSMYEIKQEKDLFDTLEDLKNSVFGELEKKEKTE